MDFLNYQFHKKSYPELTEFLKAVENERIDNTDPLLRKYLPKNSGLISLSNKLRAQQDDQIIIIDDENDIVPTGNKSVNQNVTVVEPLNVIYDVDELANVVKDCVITNKQLPDEVLRKLSDDVLLSPNLTADDIYNLGKHLCEYDYNATELVQRYYKSVLVPKLTTERSLNFQQNFVRIYRQYSHVLKNDLLNLMLCADEATNLLENVHKLESTDKNSLLSSMICEINKLEPKHLQVILYLLDVNTELEVKRKIVELMSISADDFATDRTYGKVLINVITCLGRNVNLVDSSVRQIVTKHKSVWKMKAEKQLALVDESNLLSQSVRY